MRCDLAQELLSERADGELTSGTAALDAHVATCGDCRAFLHGTDLIRHSLRVQAVAEVGDIASSVRRELERRQRARVRSRRPALFLVAATFVVAFAVGALSAGLFAPNPAVAEGIGRRVLAAQAGVESLTAEVEIVEHGWHPEVPVRRAEGSLVYRAPETLVLVLEDRTEYPSKQWRSNDTALVVDDDRAWQRGTPRCPSSAQPGCSLGPRTVAWERREPFAAPVPSALDLVVPVTSFAPDGPVEDLGTRRIGSRDTVGVAVPAAQVAPVLDTLTSAGNWRAFHPSDRAEVWLDERWMVPLDVVVTAGSGDERERWAAAHGYADAAGDVILAVRFRAIAINEDVEIAAPPVPTEATSVAGAFTPGPVEVPEPTWLPDGFAPHLTGAVLPTKGTDIRVASWTDGRAWVKVRATVSWDQPRLFGDLGGVVRRVDLEDGVVYVAEGGRTVALHGDDVDVVVTGSIAPVELLRVADSLEVTGRAVPSGWAEAAASMLTEAIDARPGLLVPTELAGFGPPGVQVGDGAVVLGYAGAGDRALVIVQRSGIQLGPPLAADVLGVEVRGTAGRYTPGRGELEWVEGDTLVALRSRTLNLTELLAVADSLEAAA
ncbi:MAG: zf-HC2 domain-containing protein [Actinobacteria bacterium]|nr:zf-HC2 domain-containing protein [Actinomycetota bacterium]